MDKRTEQYFKSILAEEPADYSRPPRFASSYFGKLRYYLSQFRHINYAEAFQNMISGAKELGGNIMSVLNKKIEKPKSAEEKPAEPVESAEPAETKPVEPAEPIEAKYAKNEPSSVAAPTPAPPETKLLASELEEEKEKSSPAEKPAETVEPKKKRTSSSKKLKHTESLSSRT